MNRFRPNLVVTGTGQPFEEDAWEAVLIEGPGHDPCKILCTIPCDRCKVGLLLTHAHVPKLVTRTGSTCQLTKHASSLQRLRFCPENLQLPGSNINGCLPCLAMGLNCIRGAALGGAITEHG